MHESWEARVPSLGQVDPLEEGMATHSSILAWRIPWTEEPGGLQSMGSQRVRHDWSNLAHGTALHLWTSTPPDIQLGSRSNYCLVALPTRKEHDCATLCLICTKNGLHRGETVKRLTLKSRQNWITRHMALNKRFVISEPNYLRWIMVVASLPVSPSFIQRHED